MLLILWTTEGGIEKLLASTICENEKLPNNKWLISEFERSPAINKKSKTLQLVPQTAPLLYSDARAFSSVQQNRDAHACHT